MKDKAARGNRSRNFLPLDSARLWLIKVSLRNSFSTAREFHCAPPKTSCILVVRLGDREYCSRERIYIELFLSTFGAFALDFRAPLCAPRVQLHLHAALSALFSCTRDAFCSGFSLFIGTGRRGLHANLNYSSTTPSGRKRGQIV